MGKLLDKVFLIVRAENNEGRMFLFVIAGLVVEGVVNNGCQLLVNQVKGNIGGTSPLALTAEGTAASQVHRPRQVPG